MAIFGGGNKNDISIPVSFTDWKKSLEELKSAVKNTSLTVSLNVDNKVYNTIQTKLSSVIEREYTLNINYKPVVASISTALQDVVKDFSTSFSNIKVSLNVDGQKEAIRKELKDIPIEIRLEYEKAIKEMEKRITDHKASIKLSEFVAENDGLEKVAKSMQEWFNNPQNSVTLFNKQTRIDKTVLVQYLKRLVLEINRAMTTDEALKIAFLPDTQALMKKVDEEIPELEAAVTVPIELDTSKLDAISEDITKLLDSITEKLADVSFNKIIDDVHSVVTEYAATIGSMSQATKTVVDECIENIERIGKMDSIKLPEIDSAVKDTLEALVNVTNNENLSADSDLVKFFDSLGQAISDFNDRKLDTTIINDFANAITSLNTSMGSVATVADTMMNGAFGKLLDAVNGVDTSRLRALTAELSKFARSLSASETFGNLIEAINKVKDAVNDLPNTFDTVFNELRSALSDIQTEIRTSIGGISIPAPNVNVSAPASSGTVTIDSADCIVNAINRVARHIVVSRTVNTRTITTGVSDIVSAISGISITIPTPPPSPAPVPPGPGSSPRSRRSGGGSFDAEDSPTIDEGVIGKVKAVADFIRQLNQAGISFNHTITSAVFKLSGWLQGFSGASKIIQGLEQKVLHFYAKANVDFTSSARRGIREMGLDLNAVVEDANGARENIVDVWKDCAEAAYAYRDTLKGKKLNPSEIEKETNEYAKKLFRERTTGTGKRVLDSGGTQVGTAQLEGAFNIIQGKGSTRFITDMFTSVFSRGIVPRILGFITRLGTRILAFVTTLPGILIAGAVTLLWKAWRAWANRRHEENKRQAQMQLMMAKQQGEMELRYVQQKAQAEQRAIKAASEIRKKQSEQQMALYEKGMSSYSFEVKAQERIYQLELMRLKAVKENENIQKRLEAINENISKEIEHANAIQEKMHDIKLQKDILNLGGLLRGNGAIMGDGSKMDDSLRRLLGGWGNNIKSFMFGDLNQEDIQELVKGRLEAATSELQGMFTERINTIKESNSAFIDEVTALQATATGATKKELDEMLTKYAQWQRQMNETRIDSVTGEQYTLAGRGKYMEMLSQNAEQYVKTHYSKELGDNGGMIIVGEDGNDKGLEGSYEEVLAQFKKLQQESGRYKQEMEAWYAQGNFALNEQYKLIRDRAVKEQQINEQMKKAIEAQTNLQTELKKKLTDRLIGLWDSFGDWRTTNQSKIQVSRMSQLDALQQVQLADPRYLRNQDAKIALQVQQAQEKYMMKNRGELAVAHDEERFNLGQEQIKALWDLEKQHEMAKHKIEMDNITKISNAQSNNIKLQRELIKRFMDHAVAQFKIYNDPYGRNVYDTQKELANIQIEKRYDSILTQLKKRDNLANTRWEMRQEQKIQDDVMKEQEKQLAIKQAAEEEWLKKKQDLEIQLLELEFKMRMRQIKAEVEYKHALEQAQENMANAGTEEMLGGREITIDELRAIGKNVSADASPEEVKKIVAFLTQEEKNQIATGRMKEMDIRFEDIVKRIKETNEEEYNAAEAKAKTDILNRTDNDSIVEGMNVSVEKLKEAIEAMKNPEKATIDQRLLYNNYIRRNVVLPMAQKIQGSKDEETEKKLAEIENNRKAALAKAKAEYDAQELKRIEEEKKREEEKAKAEAEAQQEAENASKRRKENAEKQQKSEEQYQRDLEEYNKKMREYNQALYEHGEWVKNHGNKEQRTNVADDILNRLLEAPSSITVKTGMDNVKKAVFTDTQEHTKMFADISGLGLEKQWENIMAGAYNYRNETDPKKRAAIKEQIQKMLQKAASKHGGDNGDNTPEPVVPQRPKAPVKPVTQTEADIASMAYDFWNTQKKVALNKSTNVYNLEDNEAIEQWKKIRDMLLAQGVDEGTLGKIYKAGARRSAEDISGEERQQAERELVEVLRQLGADVPKIPDVLEAQENTKGEASNTSTESWEDIQTRINKEYDALGEEERKKGMAFDADLEQLADLGEAETAAILQQTKVADDNARIQQHLLEELIKVSTPDEEFKDIKKELTKLETQRTISMDRLQLTADKNVQRIETQGKANMELQKTAREDAQEGRYAQIEQQKQIAAAIKETHFENMKRQDQLRADTVKREADYRQTQRGNQTDFAISMMQAKSGTDRLKAISKYRADSDYNSQSAAMDIRHRNEMEALERRGNYTQEEKAQLEARQQDEKSSLDESKKYADAVRDAMGDVGGIRSLVSEGTGQTSDLVGTWERIQAAAFGHIEDPAADAVINMDRAQALQHASLMSLLTQQLPVIAQGINSMNYKNIVNNYNNATQGTPPTVGGWS